MAPLALNKYYNFLLEPNSSDAGDIIFIINPGQSVSQIAQNLEKSGLIKNAFAFKLLISQMGIGKNIQAGDFRISANLSSRDIAEELTHGAIDIWITLPEGIRIEEQAQKLQEKLQFSQNDIFQFDKNEFIKLAKEGYMFPDTYLIPKDATAEFVFNKLMDTFEQKVDINMLKKGSENNLTEHEIIILASIIEREGKSDQDRPIIAGVLMNRIKAGLPLQVDATVQYAKGYDASNNSWWPQISQIDYQAVKSNYNTYLYLGLPPGPISNPGLESIRAAVQPENTDYFYYLHDLDEKVHFAKTIEEHNQNIQKYR